MSRSHSFSVDVAKEFGVPVALMLNHFSFWYLKNKSDRVHYFKGDHWVRMKAATLQEYYPYYSFRQLRHLIDKMIDLKLLKQDEFNTKRNDRTKWYCLTKKSKNILNILTDKNVTNIKKTSKKTAVKLTDKNVTKVSHIIGTLTDKNVTSILKEEDIEYRYNISKEKILSNKSLLEISAMQNRVKIITLKNKVDEFILHCKSILKLHDSDKDLFSHFNSWIRMQNLKDSDLETELNWFIKVFNRIANKEYKITETLKQSFATQFAVGYSGKEFRTAIANLYSSSPENKFHLQHKFKFATPEYLLKGDNMNKYLNFKI